MTGLVRHTRPNHLFVVPLTERPPATDEILAVTNSDYSSAAVGGFK